MEQQVIIEQVSHGIPASTRRKSSFGCRAQTPVRDKPYLLGQ